MAVHSARRHRHLQLDQPCEGLTLSTPPLKFAVFVLLLNVKDRPVEPFAGNLPFLSRPLPVCD
jgi:hypothetical protein